ncbi:hypothetical protein D3C81_1677180 [compost metagenome]
MCVQWNGLGSRHAPVDQDRPGQRLPGGCGQQRRPRGGPCPIRRAKGSRAAVARRPAAEPLRWCGNRQCAYRHRLPGGHCQPQRAFLPGNPGPAVVSRRPLVPVPGRQGRQRTSRVAALGHRAGPDPADRPDLLQRAAHPGQPGLDQSRRSRLQAPAGPVQRALRRRPLGQDRRAAVASQL